MNDPYFHIEGHIFYIIENILGPVEQSTDYEQLLNNFNSELVGCNCDKVCSFPTCMCLQQSCHENYEAYYQDGHLKYKLTHQLESLPIFECNENCSCSDLCRNQIVQKGPIDGLEIRPCDKGLGLFTTCFISKGAFICEYAGELITKSQASVRHQNNQMHNKMNYIFCLKEHFGENIVETIVDPSVFGNIGRYMNHSCEPNCFIIPVRCGTPMPKLAIFAGVDILPQDELTFNYGCNDINVSSSLENRISCLCKAKNCTGFIPFHIY